MRKAAAVVFGVLTIAMSGVLTVRTAGKPAANPAVTVTLLNGIGDRIKSDGSAYVGGVSGMTAEMQYPTVLLNTATSTGKSRRYLWFTYPSGTEVSTPCDPNPPIGPTTPTSGVLYQGVVSITSVGAMQIGEARAVRLHTFAPDGEMLWLSAFNTVVGQCSGVVAAYRQDQWHWQVATSLARLVIPDGYHGVKTDGSMLDAELNWVFPSDTAQLQPYGGGFAGNYKLPFAATVYCPTCTLSQTLCPNWQNAPCAIPKS